MNEVMNEKKAANRMMEQIKNNQTVAAAMRTQRAEDVREAMEDSKDVAARIAAGDVVSATVSEPVTSEPAFSPEDEAAAGASMIDAYLQRRAARKARREATVVSYEKAVLAQAHAARNMALDLQ